MPQNLEHLYVRLNLKFDNQEWKRYDDQIIPEESDYAKEILGFIIDLIDFIGRNFDSIDRKAYVGFLGNYYYKFYYGPNGDDNNYLDFDETVNGKGVYDIFTEIWEMEEKPSKNRLANIKSQFGKLLKEFNGPTRT